MSIQNWLVVKFEERRLKNPRFSLRSFARFLDISPASLSQLLSGKRRLGPQLAEKVAVGLCLAPNERLQLLTQATQTSRRRGALKHTQTTQAPYSELSLDAFHIVSDWYHAAMINLAEVAGAKWNAIWFSERLNISVKEAASAMERLERLKLVGTNGDSYWATNENIHTPSDIVNVAVQRFHLDQLELAQSAIRHEDVAKRDFSSISFALNDQQIPYFKKEFKRFRRRMAAAAKKHANKNTVYTLNIHFFSLMR